MQKITVLIYIHQEYFCRLLRKVCFCICPLSFIQISKNVLIKGTMRMWTYANNHKKCVNKCMRVLMLLELLKICEHLKKISDYGQFDIWVSGLICYWGIFQIFFSKNAEVEIKVYNKDFRKFLEKYLWRNWNKSFHKNLWHCYSKKLILQKSFEMQNIDFC